MGIEHTLSLIWHNRNKIIGNDSHNMTIQREFLDAFGTCIDQSKSVNLSGDECEVGYASIALARGCIAWSHRGAIEVVSSLDEVVVRERGL